MKKKHLNTLKMASLTLMLGCFAVGVVYNHYEKEQLDHVVKVEKNNLQAPKQYVSYNDESYTITLSADELNSYTFNNFYSACLDAYNNNGVISITGTSYNDITGIGINMTDEYNPPKLSIWKNTGGTYSFKAVLDNSGSFTIEKYNGLNVNTFEYSLNLYVGSTYYQDFKSAIELDIQANQPVSMGDSIIGSIASGLGIIPNIAGEFLAGFSRLLWNNNQLTDFAIYSLVFLGIAITFAIVKLVLMIVRNNTGA